MNLGKDAPTPPPQPNPAAIAGAQGAANEAVARTQARLNRVNQVTPQGSISYAEGPNDRWTSTVQLSPEQQALYNTQIGGAQALGNLGTAQLGRVASAVSQPFDLAGLPTAALPDEAARSATRDRFLARTEPLLARSEEAARNRLATQGITQGSEAWRNAVDDMARARAGMYTEADTAAGNELARQFGLESSARERALQERTFLRDRPLAEFGAFMSGAAPTMPQFSAVPQTQVQAPDVIGANALAQNAALAQYNAQNQRYGSELGALSSLGAAALGGRPWR